MVDVRRLSEAERTIVEASDITVVGDRLAGAYGRRSSGWRPRPTSSTSTSTSTCSTRRSCRRTTRGSPAGPSVEQVVAALEPMFGTGRVGAFALVSLYAVAPEGDKSVAAALAILRPALAHWAARDQRRRCGQHRRRSEAAVRLAAVDLHVVEIPIAYLYGRKTLPRVNEAPEWKRSATRESTSRSTAS